MQSRATSYLGSAAAAAALLCSGVATASDAPPVPLLPSGLEAVLQEVVEDVKPDGTFDYVRFRFVAPGVVGDGAPDLEARAEDMDFLCGEYALPWLAEAGAAFDKISISISDRETEFGVANPDVTQFFELYRVENGRCIWEEF
ncbi:DUF6497 family protein [Marimonas arenosa]|uniref:DUF6497 family protein n=1 Tax=Marimonas arenosa TaxID=1795305 RepID=A0AAE3W8Y2_9RHOB|nr:DUF6497 family protein [Marimonas arenosa]MDQ2088317.1 DUF6497 family protein [Marimonas arenosa]